MRILYVVTRAGLGGAQTHVLDLVRYGLRRREVGLVSFENGPLIEEATKLGASAWAIPTPVNSINLFYDARAAARLGRITRSFQPDLIHAHSTKAGVVSRIVSCIQGVPVVFTAHGWAFTEGVPPHRAKLAVWTERITARAARRIICVSHYDYELALRHHVAEPEKMVVIHNALEDCALVCSYRERRKPRGVMVARFSPQKDFESLIAAVSLLQTKIELLLVGGGENLQAVRETASEMGLTDRVRFLGARTDVPHILADSDLFILASNWEGFPYSVLEAMRAGLPVVASNVGGVPEAVEDGVTGYLVPPRNAHALAEKLDLLFSNRELRLSMGLAGRKRFLERFTIDKMLEAVDKVYEGILS